MFFSNDFRFCIDFVSLSSLKSSLKRKKVVLQTQRNPSLNSLFKQLTPGWTDDEEFGQRSGIERSSNIRLRQLLRTKLAVNWEEWRHSGRPRQWTVLLSSWTLWSTITEYYANTYPLDENFPFRQLRFLIFFSDEDDVRIYETFHSFCVFNTMVKKNRKFINIFLVS